MDEKFATKEHGQKVFLEEFYRPPRHIQEEIFDVYEKFLKWRSLREQSYKQFNGHFFTDWLQEGREKFWGYLPLSFDNDVPQFFFPETRNQIVALLAKIANLRLKPRFEGVEGFDIIKATVLKDFFEYWRRKSNKKISNFWEFLYTIVNGTCVVFTAYRSNIKTKRVITKHDPDTGESEYKEEKEDDSEVYEEICNLEDIYIPKLWEPDIQEQDEMIWRTLMKWSDFKNLFRHYELRDMVVPGMQFADTSIFSQFISYDVRGGEFVEVMRYFNVPKDKYMIIANGVLLNPLKVKGGDKKEGKDQEVSPLPWNHKRLPFAKTIFEPLDPSFFYGLSLPQKVKTPQEALNKMWELMMEREIRSVSAPIITTDPNLELGLEFKPGRIYQVGTDINQYKELEVGPTDASYWNALVSLQGLINRTGSGGTLPISPGRQPRSATEKAMEDARIKEAGGLYILFYQDLLEQIAWLAIQNMIQFYTAEKTEKILGNRKFRKILSLIDIELAGGGMGNREIRITERPTEAKDLRDEAWYASVFKKERKEIIEVTPDALRQMRFDIKIDMEVDQTPEGEKAIFLDFLLTLQRLFGQYGLLDPKKMLFRSIEKMGENVADYIPDALVSDYERERFGLVPVQPPVPPPGGPGQAEGGTPTLNAANQRIRGQAYGAAGPAAAGGLPIESPLPAKGERKEMSPAGSII